MNDDEAHNFAIYGNADERALAQEVLRRGDLVHHTADELADTAIEVLALRDLVDAQSKVIDFYEKLVAKNRPEGLRETNPHDGLTLREAVEGLLLMHDRHDLWCGYNVDAPGDPSHWQAVDAARIALDAPDDDVWMRLQLKEITNITSRRPLSSSEQAVIDGGGSLPGRYIAGDASDMT